MRAINALVVFLVIGLFATAKPQTSPAPKTVRFSGKIEGWKGRPFANQTVHLRAGALEVTTETDGEGRFLFSSVPANQTYRLTLADSPLNMGSYTVGEDDFAMTLSTSLDAPIQISGRVVGCDGAAIQNRPVTLIRSDGGSTNALSDPDGKFAFPPVAPNQKLSLRISAPGVGLMEMDLTAEDRDLPLGTFVLQPMPFRLMDVVRAATPSGAPVQPARISGRITDRNGKPLADQTVSLFNRDLFGKVSRWDLVQGTLKTGQNGEFIFPAEGRSDYSIVLSPHGDRPGYQGFGDMEIADGVDVEIGSIAVQTTADKGQIGQLVGPVTVTPRPPAKGSPAASLSKTSYIAGIFVGSGGATVIQNDGKVIRIPEEKDQVSIDSPLLAEDRSAAGWLVETPFCCTSYPLPFQLVLFRPGKPLLHLTGDGRMFSDWRFIAGGKQAAFSESFPHGDPHSHMELHDVQTGRLLGQWDDDSTSTAPAWTHGLQ